MIYGAGAIEKCEFVGIVCEYVFARTGGAFGGGEPHRLYPSAMCCRAVSYRSTTGRDRWTYYAFFLSRILHSATDLKDTASFKVALVGSQLCALTKLRCSAPGTSALSTSLFPVSAAI